MWTIKIDCNTHSQMRVYIVMYCKSTADAPD